MKRRVRSGFALGALLVVVAVLVPVRQRLDAGLKPWLRRENMTWLVQGTGVKPFLLGYDETYAAFLWIRTTLYVGEGIQEERDFAWLVPMVDAVTRINPRFLPPLEFAALLLPSLCGAADAARIILERGMCTPLAQHWRVPFYLGWLYFSEFNDRERAAHFLAVAAGLPGVPIHIVHLAATLREEVVGSQEAVLFLESVVASAQDPTVQLLLSEKLRHFRARL